MSDIVDTIFAGISHDKYDRERVEQELENHIQREIDKESKNIKTSAIRSYCKMVHDMRTQQKRYFQTKSKEALRESKKLEKEVDRILKIVLE